MGGADFRNVSGKDFFYGRCPAARVRHNVKISVCVSMYISVYICCLLNSASDWSNVGMLHLDEVIEVNELDK